MATRHDLVDLSQRAAESADPGEALRAVAELRAQLESLELDNVERAVDEGRSWAEIADSLGVSRQAAHKRYAKRLRLRRSRRNGRAARRNGRPPGSPAERIVVTAQARRAVRAAQIAAPALGHSEADGAHLLLGLLADTDGAAARALAGIGVDFDAVRDHVATLDLPKARLDGRKLTASVAGQIPISAPARAALEQSLREAARLGHRHLGVEHLLLALLRETDGTALAALTAVGARTDDLERCLGKVLKESPFVAQG
jgi:hypothetical protein